MPTPKLDSWTLERLRQLIADRVEENLELEYKRADSLDRQNNKTTEITKDVSAMANSSGGTIVYGIAESKHLPEKLDPVVRAHFSREWLEQIIHTIQPRIGGVRIQVLSDDTDSKHCYFIVAIPQSDTAHQARDHKYYKRHNFMAIPMEDYEIRDVMNRRKYCRLIPKLALSIGPNQSGNLCIAIKVDVTNTGLASAQEAYIRVGVFMDKAFEVFPGPEWTTRTNTAHRGFACRTAIHPNEEILFLNNIAMKGHFEGLEELPKQVRCTFRIFARDTPVLAAEAVFLHEELRAAAFERKPLTRIAEVVQPI